jgi:hypothetical protein
MAIFHQPALRLDHAEQVGMASLVPVMPVDVHATINPIVARRTRERDEQIRGAYAHAGAVAM